MSWIISKDGAFLSHGNKIPDFTLSELQEIFPAKYGGVLADYGFYELKPEENEKFLDGSSYQLLFENGNLIGIDFSPEESKPWAKVSIDKEYIKNDGVDSAIITLEIWKPDLSGIDTEFQMLDVRAPIKTPHSTRIVHFDIVNGVAQKTFKTSISGTFIFPAVSKRYNTMRIFNQVVIEVDDGNILS